MSKKDRWGGLADGFRAMEVVVSRRIGENAGGSINGNFPSYFCLFVSVIHGRPRRQLRCHPGLFLAKVRLLDTEIANHLFEGQRCSRTACTGHPRSTVGGPSQDRDQNEVFAAHYLASLEQAAMIHQELASERAAQLLSLVDAHVATPAARSCVHWPPSSAVCLG